MNRLADILSRMMSVLLYPLFIPTYGMILFCCAYAIHVRPLPFIWSLVAIIGTFILTCFLGFAFWAYFLIQVLKAPIFLGFIAVGATIAIGLIALINRVWKISAHLTGMGGLFGGLMSYCLAICATPTWGTIIGWLLISLLLMYARIRLDAHTPAQVCAGWLLGITCTFIPYCFAVYAL